MSLTIPKVVYIILGIILIWISINVTNCSGRCRRTLREPFLCGYLRVQYDFPRCPRKLHRSQLPVRGSASRVPVFQHLAEQHADGRRRFESTLASTSPSLPCSPAIRSYILLMAGVMIVDGESALSKYFYPFPENRDPQKKNTRTPLHDHVRLKYKWSDSQVVIRFVILQILLAVIAYLIVA